MAKRRDTGPAVARQAKRRGLDLQQKVQRGHTLTPAEQRELARWEDEQRRTIALEWLGGMPKADLERLLGKPRSTLISWATNWGFPYPPQSKSQAQPVDGVKACQWLANFLAENSQRLRRLNEGVSTDAAERLRKAQADLAEFKLEEAMGKYILTEHAESIYGAFADKVSEALTLLGERDREAQQLVIDKLEEWSQDERWRPQEK